MLILNRQVHETIAAHGAASYPYEGCGLLLGSTADGHTVVRQARPMANVWPVEGEKPERFRIDPADWLTVEMAAAAEGLDVVGIFHSHPDHPPVASPRDLAWASWPGYSYLITQIIGGEPADGRSWQLMPDRSGFVEEPVEVVEDNLEE